MQGGHQLPQKSRTIYFSFIDISSTFSPARDNKLKFGADAPSIIFVFASVIFFDLLILLTLASNPILKIPFFILRGKFE